MVSSSLDEYQNKINDPLHRLPITWARPRLWDRDRSCREINGSPSVTVNTDKTH